MQEKYYDVVVVGAGSGGYTTAIKLAKLGFKVAIIEKDKIGGVCLNYGCIPTKTYLSALNLFLQKNRYKRMGINLDVSLDFLKLFKYKEFVVKTLTKGIEMNFKKAKVEVFLDKAYIHDEGAILLENSNIRLVYKYLVLDLGSKPKYLADFDRDLFKTSKDLLVSQDILKDIAIIGAGVIGLEFANIFNLLSLDVTLIEYLPEVLPSLDRDIIDILIKEYKKRKIKFYLNSTLDKIEKKEDRFDLTIKNRQDLTLTKISSLQNLVSIGRIANSDIGGFNKIFPVNDRDKTFEVEQTLNIKGFKNVYAVGDCASQPYLAHKAYYDSDIVINNIVSKEKKKVDYQKIPFVIFSKPSISYVGYSYKVAKQYFSNVDIVDYPYSAISKAFVENSREGFVRLVLNKDNIIGVEIIGFNSQFLLAGFLPYFRESIYKIEDIVIAHPTLSEVQKEVVDLKRNLSVYL